MGRYTNMLSKLLEKARPRDAWGFWTDLALILYAARENGEILEKANQIDQWAELVCICAREIWDVPLDDRQPQKNIPADCVMIVRDILGRLAESGRPLGQGAAGLLDELLQQMVDQKYLHEFVTPRSLADLMAEMAVPRKPCRVLDPVCGSGRLLLAARRVSPEAALLGIERGRSIETAALLRLRMDGSGDCDVKRGDFFDLAPRMERKFDVILANPPYDSDLRDTVYYICAFLKLLEPGGRCAALVPEGLLSNATNQNVVELRGLLLREQNLEAVISLPLKIYLPYTESHSSLLLFRKDPGRGEVFFGRIPDREGPERGHSDRVYQEDMGRVLRGWKCWSAGKPLPEDAEALCWTADQGDIERTEGYILSAERYAPSVYIHRERRLGELEQARRYQHELEDLLLRYMAEQEAGDGL